MIQTSVHEENGIGEIILDRQEKMNAITLEGRRKIGEAMMTMDADQRVRVIVVKGAGNKAFSSGGDIGEFLSTSTDDLLRWGRICPPRREYPSQLLQA